MTMPYIVPEQPLLLGLLHVHTTIGLDLLASIGGIVKRTERTGPSAGCLSNVSQKAYFILVI